MGEERRDSVPLGPNGIIGGGGMSAAICDNGINAVVPLSNRMVYGRSVRLSSEDVEASRGK